MNSSPGRLVEILIRDLFGTNKAAAEYFNVAEQYISSWIKKGEVPFRYASYLSRKHGIPAFMFNYNDYVLMCDVSDAEYIETVKEHLSPVSARYVLEGKLPDKKKIYKENDKRWM